MNENMRNFKLKISITAARYFPTALQYLPDAAQCLCIYAGSYTPLDILSERLSFVQLGAENPVMRFYEIRHMSHIWS